jgi:23S rRNA (uracil1939-C5)-methyltransferase
VLERDRPGLIVLDPPRAGAGLEACALLKRIAPETIVYVSCDPTTLARDLAALAPVYTIARMHMFDLFPQTSHLESVAVLVR